jgi:hypothetical protein
MGAVPISCGGTAAITRSFGGGEGAPDAGLEQSSPPGGSQSAEGGTLPADCVEGTQWIYLVDTAGHMVRFDPGSLTAVDLGRLSCWPPAQEFKGARNKIAIDRSGRVLVKGYFQNVAITLMRTDLTNASCTALGDVQTAFDFHMAYARAPGEASEVLYVAAHDWGVEGPKPFGVLDVATRTTRQTGGVPMWSEELTGSSAGELWNVLPAVAWGSVARLQQISRVDGSTVGSGRPLTGLATENGETLPMVFWGGSLWLFKPSRDLNVRQSEVWRLDLADGSLQRLLAALPYSVASAATSTCAPVMLN